MGDPLFEVELPVELLAECLSLLPRFKDLLACACVSRHWNIASESSFVWKRQCNRKWFSRKGKPAPEQVPTLIAVVTENASWKMYAMHRRKICSTVDAQLRKMIFRRTRRDALRHLCLYADYVDVKLEAIHQSQPLEDDMTRKFYARIALQEINKERLKRRWQGLSPQLIQKDPLWRQVHKGACLIDCWMNLCDPDDLEAKMESLASSVSIPANLSLRKRLDYVVSTWKDEWQFSGNTTQYYDDRNSFISSCLDRKTGIPITLSVIFTSICRYHGIPIDLIGSPGHFVVAFTDPDKTTSQTLFIDVFNGCQFRTREEMEEMFEGQVYPASGSFLDPITPQECYSRMLRNLSAIYQQSSNVRGLLEICDQQAILDTFSPGGLPSFDSLVAGVELRIFAKQFEEAMELSDILIGLPTVPAPILKRVEINKIRLARESQSAIAAEESICPAVEAITKSQLKRPKYRIGQIVTLKPGQASLYGVILRYDLDHEEGQQVIIYQMLCMNGRKYTGSENDISAPKTLEGVDLAPIIHLLGEYFERRDSDGRFAPNERMLIQFPNC